MDQAEFALDSWIESLGKKKPSAVTNGLEDIADKTHLGRGMAGGGRRVPSDADSLAHPCLANGLPRRPGRRKKSSRE